MCIHICIYVECVYVWVCVYVVMMCVNMVYMFVCACICKYVVCMYMVCACMCVPICFQTCVWCVFACMCMCVICMFVVCYMWCVYMVGGIVCVLYMWVCVCVCLTLDFQECRAWGKHCSCYNFSQRDTWVKERGSRQRYPLWGCFLKLTMVRCRSPSRATQAVSEDEGQRRHRSSSSALLPLWSKTPHGALIHIASDCACAWLKGGVPREGVGRWTRRYLEWTGDDALQLCTCPSSRRTVGHRAPHRQGLLCHTGGKGRSPRASLGELFPG